MARLMQGYSLNVVSWKTTALFNVSIYNQLQGGGMQAKLEETFNLNKWATLSFTGFYYFIHTYNGLPGNSLVGIFKPSITVRLFKNLSIGIEHHIYHNDRFLKHSPDLRITRTEQKLFLQLFLEDEKRYGRYH